jgi:hypothetical protein
VSVLRYLYIIKAEWLHENFPDPSKLKESQSNHGFCNMVVQVNANDLKFTLAGGVEVLLPPSCVILVLGKS